MKLLHVLAESIDLSQLPQTGAGGDGSSIKEILTLVWMLAGAVSLIIITFAGFKYVISQGESQAVAKAKNTIIYAIIGLIVSIMAIAIVNFVFGNL